MGDCAWVTQALQVEDVDKALVLGKSLRRVFTTRKLVVIVQDKISLGLRDILETTFDFVLHLDPGKCRDLEDVKMTSEALATTFAFSFTFFHQCIYLPPNSVVLKNCDDLFDVQIEKRKMEESGDDKTKFCAFRFQPSHETFKSLTAYLSKNKENDVSNMVLAQWLKKQSLNSFMFLEGPYSAVVEMQGKKLLKNDNSLVIAQLPDLQTALDLLEKNGCLPEKNGFTTPGLLEKFIYEYWLEIYQKEIKVPIATVIDSQEPGVTVPPSRKPVREPIAIVGMSCRYPSSNNVAEFWDLLIEGRDGIRTPPDNRWTREQSIWQNVETRNTQAGFLSVPVDLFDAKFFGISPKEMVFIDPQHRIIHELVWEALEDAGINPLDLNGTQCGVFMGSWRNDYYDILHRSSSMEFYRGYMGNSIGAGAARISHLLGLTGPCIATESGCSAAMVAVHMACRSLQNGEANMALACGVNMLLHPFTTDIMPMVTATDGHCKSFDAQADGFGRAEGAGVLVLKRLSDAVRDCDSIWGIIKGTAIAQEGISKSMGTPTVECEAQAMRTALQDANVHPSQVSYVESHGTGTIVGDPMEVAAIERVYSECRTEPLIIGSVKTNVGHTEACSGITGIMKVILSIKHEVIPKHKNFKELNPEIKLESIPAQLPLEPIKWPKMHGKLRTAGVSSFGITGTDGHVIIQETPEYTNQRVVFKGFERPLHLLTISARTDEAFEMLLERYKGELSRKLPENAFPNMAYTANVGRAKFNWRAAVIAKDPAGAVTQLESIKLIRAEVAPEDMTGKICFLFTGQGSQYRGMAKELYHTNPVFHMHFDYCEDILTKNHNISIAKTFWGQENEQVSRTLYSQTGIFVIEYCLMKLWKSWGVKPDYVLGHSLGEFCAAVCAGILTVEEALTLVAERSRLIDALPQGKMLVIKRDKSTVDSLLKRYVTNLNDSGFWLDYAAINASDQTVLAGDSEKVLAFSEWLKRMDVKSSVLNSTHAFHSRHMDPILQEYWAIAEKIFMNKTNPKLACAYVSGMLGKVLDVSNDQVDWPDYWMKHTREKVRFLSASRAVYNEGGCRLFLEVGPHPVLTAFTMMNNEGKSMICLPSLRRNESDWMTLLTTVGKLFVNGAVEIDWKRFDQFYERKKVGQLLPTYPFQGSKYWPSIMNSAGMHIHPLLGSAISNPTISTIFQNSISLHNADYLKDHVIGSTIVFPGAGYMEILLMAGHATLNGATTEFRLPKNPIQLTNFRIEAPLGLEEGVGCVCQTLVEYKNTNSDEEGQGDSLDSGGFYARVYHEMKENEDYSSKWIPHASALFTPYTPIGDSKERVAIEDHQYYIEAMDRLKTTGKEESNTKEFYDRLGDVGLKFGASFRTISKVWRATEEGKEFLAEVYVPKDAGNYLVHPTLIDAMIQASVFHGERNKKIEKKLQVPIGCERFVWLGPLATKELEKDPEDLQVCYLYSNGSSRTVILLNSEGNPAAAVVKVEAIETNAKSIQALLETQVRYVPEMYKWGWKPTLGPSQERLVHSWAPDAVANIKTEITDQSDYSEMAIQSRRDMDIMVTNYITSAFLNFGWNPTIGDSFSVDSFTSGLGLKQQHKQLIRQFLIYLEEENLLIGDGDKERHWTVKNLPEEAGKLLEQCEEILHYHSSMGKDVSDFLLVHEVGIKLDKILMGTESALRILFPDDESKPSAGKYYDCGLKRTKEMLYDSWCKIWNNYKTAYAERKQPFPVIRMLEVGAGTGFGTDTVVKSLEDCGIRFEYHYTDISAAFFPGAEKRFEKYKKSFKFRKLNLEQDPTSQGFPPNYFDFVIAAQVIHATRDMKECFMNLGLVLKPTGNLIVTDSLQCKRSVDMIFGVLEGFWRFTDFELRPHHATLQTFEKWELLGKQTGFNECDYCRTFEFALICYRVDAIPLSYDVLSRTLNDDLRKIHQDSRVAWLLFYGPEEEEYVSKLKSRFEHIGRKTLILVKHSDKSIIRNGEVPALQQKYEIRSNDKEDMENLFTILRQAGNRLDDKNGFSSIEGVLVMWGLFGTGRDQTELAKPFMYLIQNLLQLNKKEIPEIIVLTAGQYPVGDILCENPSPSTLLGVSRCAANEHNELRIRGIDLDPAEIYSGVDDTFRELFTLFYDDVFHFCAFRGKERLIPKLLPEKIHPKGGSLPLPPSTDRFQLIHPQSKSMQDLEFGDLELFTLKPNEIEVKVKCSALNFKDILNILKPTDDFKDSDGVGFDFAGVVTAIGEGVTQRQVGEPVFGINLMGTALPSYIKLPEDAVAQVPESCTFTEAACFPAVFSTAYYCLVSVANVKKGETLLIHTASGGVGLLTIQLAKYFGLNIICTAGNRRKRAYLKSLGIQHVFHSRNTNYGKEIMEVTNGRGIDIVMNSLTGHGFKEATLGACAKGARFVEMSKLNIWTEEEFAERRPDVQYTIVDLTKLDEQKSRDLLGDANKLLEQRVVQPIPYTRFDAQNIRDALSYLQKAQHLGKVVVTMPEQIPGCTGLHQMYTPLYNDRSTYLITGGLGGVGMEVCKYMIYQGAKNIVLMGRSPPSDQANEVINNLNKERGCNIIVVQADVGDFDQCQNMFRKIKDLNFPPLRGVMHAAGAIADALIENQKWEDYEKTFQSKILGSWNLHELTKDTILEHFVLFSSVTAPIGSPGQSTHVSACTFEDTMAHYRVSHGLPATTINWGQFGQVGIAAEKDVLSIRPFSPQQGLNALDLILRQNRNYLVVASFEQGLATVVKFLPYSKRFLDATVFTMTDTSQLSKKSLQLSSVQFWEEYTECKDEREKKVDLIKNRIITVLRHVLRMEADEPVDDNADLQDLGVDSLMMLELKNHLQEILGDRVTVTQSALKDCTTVSLLADRLVQIIDEEGEFSVVEPPTMEAVLQMVTEDSKLPEHILVELPGSEKKPSEIKVLLMTGATGVLGSHMIREILEECPQLEKIYALVRTRGGESADERLATVLERKCLMSHMKNFDKVEGISGNFIENKLGMTDGDYEQLVSKVDAVLHCGAKVSHVEYYRNILGGRNDARSVNVGGLLKIMQFCGATRTKHLFNASTMLAVHDVAEDRTLSESWADMKSISIPHNRGYTISKYVCDLLLQQACVDRNMPCKSFRYAELRGSRVTGGSLIATSHFMKSFLFALKEGIMADTPFVSNCIPIDLASKMTARIMLRDDAPYDLYNVSHPEPQLVQEYFPRLAHEIGYNVTIVDAMEFRQRVLDVATSVEQTPERQALLAEFHELYKEEERMYSFMCGALPSLRTFLENTPEFWRSKKLTTFVPDLYNNIESSYEIHKRDLLEGKREGIFEKLGL